MTRAILPERVIERIRSERLRPRPTQWDYLHLVGLRDALANAFRTIDLVPGPVLDLYCGTRPYDSLIPRRPVWGMDRDRHFGRADVLSDLPLPFPDQTFAAILCTQALYLVDDPEATVTEMHRVLAPGGYAVVTVPHIFRRELATERRYSPAQLAAMFGAWAHVSVTGIGGPGTGLAFFPGSVAGAVARHFKPARLALPFVSLAINGAGWAMEKALSPLAGRWPASLIAVARRSDS
jgi:SAM-dependent methyltransferase